MRLHGENNVLQKCASDREEKQGTEATHRSIGRPKMYGTHCSMCDARNFSFIFFHFGESVGSRMGNFVSLALHMKVAGHPLEESQDERHAEQIRVVYSCEALFPL